MVFSENEKQQPKCKKQVRKTRNLLIFFQFLGKTFSLIEVYMHCCHGRKAEIMLAKYVIILNMIVFNYTNLNILKIKGDESD